MKIWEEKAEIQLPEGFEEATVGEKRKTYGMGNKLPDKMYIVRDKHVIISTFSQELKEYRWTGNICNPVYILCTGR